MSYGTWRSAAWRILREIYVEFGIGTRLATTVIGSYLSFAANRENRRLENGWTYETPSFCEKKGRPGRLPKRMARRFGDLRRTLRLKVWRSRNRRLQMHLCGLKAGKSHLFEGSCQYHLEFCLVIRVVPKQPNHILHR
jgi:hypothetical protein